MTFKILILSLLLSYQPSAFAFNRCESFFSDAESKLIEIPSSAKITSRIQDAIWLKKRLNMDGELEKLKKSDLFKDHNEFFSETLYEIGKLLLKDFFGKNSELKDVVGAEILLKLIIEDIKKHRGEHTVTYEYFFKINLAISKLMALKNKTDREKDLSKWNSMLEHASHRELPLYSYKINDYFMKLMSNLEYSSKLQKFSESGMYFIPTFAELSQKDFIELGIEVVPIGMTLNANSTYDGAKNESAFAYFFHDVTHGDIMQIQWRQLSPENKARYLRFQKFITSSSLKLSREEDILLTAFIFENIHEYGLFELILSEYEKPFLGFNKEVVLQKIVSDTFSKLQNPLYNSQYIVRLTRPEFIQILEVAIKKSNAQYLEFLAKQGK